MFALILIRMGIPSYFSSVVKKHGKILKPLSLYEPRFFQNMYMDCNSIIYDSFRLIEQTRPELLDDHVELESHIIQDVVQKISEYIRYI